MAPVKLVYVSDVNRPMSPNHLSNTFQRSTSKTWLKCRALNNYITNSECCCFVHCKAGVPNQGYIYP